VTTQSLYGRRYAAATGVSDDFDNPATTGDAALDEALRGLSVESVVREDLARLETDAAHRAAVRKLIWQRIPQINGRLGYCSRPWYKALEILDELDAAHPLPLTADDALIGFQARERLDHFRYNASVDPESWWHTAELWRTFCADRQWVPEENLSCDQDWENAPAAGREYGADWLCDDLAEREKARRAALWSLATAKRLGKLPDELAAEESAAAAVLARIRDLDKDFPIGPAAAWTVEEVKARVTPSSARQIRLEDIPEPWASRFLIASIGSTICAAGHPLDDWNDFLYLWEKENEQ
jgi:hypothetical protein